MSQTFFKLIQSGSTAELADAVQNDPSLARLRDSNGVSALTWSIYTGQALARDFILAELIHQHVDLDIFEAAATGNIARLAETLAADSQAAQSYSTDGWTPLHLAAAFATPAAVQLLLQHGAKVDAVAKNPQANQPLHAALALSRNAESIQLLLAAGATPDALQTGGFTPICAAIRTKHPRTSPASAATSTWPTGSNLSPFKGCPTLAPSLYLAQGWA